MDNHTIFVFGSNTEGRHGAGAALDARMYWGAKYGQARGLQGNSYAICTKNLDKGTRSVALEDIQSEINILCEYAEKNPQLDFLVTAIGTGLAGFTIEEISPMFDEMAKLDNVRFFNDWRLK